MVKFGKSSDLEYFLIDLALYLSEENLFYDHAYFELSTLLHNRGERSLEDWQALLGSIGGPGISETSAVARGDDLGLIQVVSAVREEVVDWIERHEPNRLSYLESQFLLAQTAA